MLNVCVPEHPESIGAGWGGSDVGMGWGGAEGALPSRTDILMLSVSWTWEYLFVVNIS